MRYKVAKGKSIITRLGVMNEGQELTQDMFTDSEALQGLADSGKNLVEVIEDVKQEQTENRESNVSAKRKKKKWNKKENSEEEEVSEIGAGVEPEEKEDVKENSEMEEGNEIFQTGIRRNYQE